MSTFKINLPFYTGSRKNNGSKFWKPPALRSPVLVLTILICWTLISILQYLLTQSQRNGGIIFAPKVSDLPFGEQFLYLYLPTVISVVFSIYWAWIDLETKRMEPYYQLSKENGALGKDSLLLHYPFDFIPFVPIKAFKDRHWPVFWASFAVVLVTWGLVPIQAGIFSVESISRNFDSPFLVSKSFIPAEQQATNLTLRYAQSTYGIVSLNETLPPYMARNYTLTPFKPTDMNRLDGSQGTWNALTTMYSVDLYCEVTTARRDTRPRAKAVLYTSNGGCNVTLGLTGNVTKGFNANKLFSPLLVAKDYMAMYIGYHNEGNADFSLEGDCPTERNHTFYAAFSANKLSDKDPPNNVTAMFCEPTYYQQWVNATVDMITKQPLTVTPVGDKQPIPIGVFNSTYLESQMNGGSSYEVRGDTLPLESLPDYLERIAETNVSLTTGPTGSGTVQPMVGLALEVSKQPLEKYLDWKVLSKSYADAYRVLFARAMVDILSTDFQFSEKITGRQQITTEAVVLEPVFTYIVEGLLGVVSLAAIALLYLSITRQRNLRSDPNTVASVMSLVADNEALLAHFEDLDCCTMAELQQRVGHRRYRLTCDANRTGIVEIDNTSVDSNTGEPPILPQHQNIPREIAKPVRPIELGVWMSVTLVGLFVTLAVTLAVVFTKAQANGLPLPSTVKIVQNILENYIPTALATLIEPIWILINRLLCMLQPIEELQNCNARAKKSIDLNYSSLPPQFVVFRALRSKHFVLAAVCAMVLLANLLAVAFAGIFNQDTLDIMHTAAFSPPLKMQFVAINGSIGPKNGQVFGSLEPSGAYRGGNPQDQFLIAESNFTRDTPLPSWTDEKMFYLPFITTAAVNATESVRYQARTPAFGAELDCETLEFGVDYRARLLKDRPNLRLVFNATAGSGSNKTECSSNGESTLRWGPVRPGPRPEVNGTCQRGPSAAEVTFQFNADVNATQKEKDACMQSIVMGWIRAPNGSCGDFEDRDLDKENSVFVRCKPRLVKGSATVQVDSGGRLQDKAKDVGIVENLSRTDTGEMFNNDPINLIGQSNRYLFRFSDSGWHNDSYAEDFMNYFAMRESNSSRLIDPKQGLPTLDEIQKPLGKAYSRLFAIWLGANKEKLLVAYGEEEKKTLVQGYTVAKERRLFVSTPMFVISEAILCTYAIVAIMVYMRRPGKYLPRLPTSVASIISLFAASAAVQDMRDKSHLSGKERARYLEELGSRYGYGSYVGAGDGRVHIGIEISPFVRVRSKTTWLERKITFFRQGSAGKE